MAAAVSVDQKADRAALVRKARRLADQIEGLYSDLDHAGALVEVRRHFIVHYEEPPPFDLMQMASALRCFAGTLSSITTTAPKTEPTPESHGRPRVPGTPPVSPPQIRIDSDSF